MSDEQCAFDNWEDAAQEVDNLEETVQQKEEEQIKEQQKVIEQKKPEIAKITMKDRIQYYKNQKDQDFIKQVIEGVSDANKNVKKLSGNQIMKNNKDFQDFANQIVDRLGRDVGEDPIDDNCLATFVQELALYLYKGLQWKNFDEINKKLKIAKNWRKTEQKKIAKQKQKLERQKKNEELLEGVQPSTRIQQNAYQDELFGGAAMINSKQEEEERKKKAAELQAKKEEEKKVEEQKPPVAEDEDDDDDFM